LKYLDDPKGIYPKDVCAIVSRRGFEEDMPEAATFFKNFTLNEDELYELMADVEADGEEAGARKYYEAHKAQIDGFFN
jgi:glycine betaine/proline transport system substrate-binding protein